MSRLRLVLTGFAVLSLLLVPVGCARKPAGKATQVAGLTGGTLVFSDDFERAEPGPSWKLESSTWRIDGGWLRDTGAQNAGAWLLEDLPERVRIEFKVRSELPAQGGFRGDIKCEVFATEPAHEAGYVLIFGGWENTINTIARLDEHGEDRLEEHNRRVVAGRTYQWAIVRTDGTLHWFLDGAPFMKYEDRRPVEGRYFGFNNWASDLYFDELRIYEL